MVRRELCLAHRPQCKIILRGVLQHPKPPPWLPPWPGGGGGGGGFWRDTHEDVWLAFLAIIGMKPFTWQLAGNILQISVRTWLACLKSGGLVWLWIGRHAYIVQLFCCYTDVHLVLVFLCSLVAMLPRSSQLPCLLVWWFTCMVGAMLPSLPALMR